MESLGRKPKTMRPKPHRKLSAFYAPWPSGDVGKEPSLPLARSQPRTTTVVQHISRIRMRVEMWGCKGIMSFNECDFLIMQFLKFLKRCDTWGGQVIFEYKFPLNSAGAGCSGSSRGRRVELNIAGAPSAYSSSYHCYSKPPTPASYSYSYF